MHNIVTVWRKAVTAELSWIGPQGPVGIPVVPLVWMGGAPRGGDALCAALPLAHLRTLDTLTQHVAAFSVTEGGTSPRTTSGWCATGTVTVTPDLEGHLFTEHLLDQECLKHPPSRLRVDSLMARRENWWWLPRMIVTLTDVTRERKLPARRAATDALLVRAHAHEPRVDAVRIQPDHPAPASDSEPEPPERISVHPRAEEGLAPLPAGRVLVFGHQHSPDFERWERWYRFGDLTEDHNGGACLAVAQAGGTPQGPLEPFGLLERFRNHRQLARACRDGIATAERRGLDSSR
ncbi:hypothetical protein RIF23_02825 [Lipingzhangella sp. LS1_29]|uniref:PRTRC genetic system protein B n=1 Tax=Lipingzhangella rawalii TaxID=2055835 RepID=A0ABU2H1R2_9ACTN|nr:hypothetical protein [Lipingzhangella rawalii]MDS1269226.1 hypothetical protein [Lipingzhangella rawalii]